MSSDFYNIKELYKLFVQFPFVCTDTRKIIPNSLFFCLKGDKFDGNLFVNEALEKGAKYVVTEKKNHRHCGLDPQSYEISRQIQNDGIIVVDDVLKTLQQLANYHRNQLNIPIIGITGTNGKTTTKELIASVLSKKYKTAYTKGNLNNHIGVPLTLLSIKKDDEIAVIEMGANHMGEIDELCQIVQPDFGLITNIGKAHLEGFGTIENIIETKTALYRAARALFVNGEDGILREKGEGRKDVKMRGLEDERMNAGSQTSPSKFEGAPEGRGSLYQKSEIIYYGNNTEFSGSILEMNPCLVINLFNKKIQTQLTGNYNLPNILGTAAIGRYFNVSIEAICDAIAEYAPQNQRSQIIKNKDNTIIADYYNANPTSVKAALENLIQIEAPNKLAILGDMLELGENSVTEHQAIIDFCELNNIETYFTGTIFYTLKNTRSQFFINVPDCNNYLKHNKLSPKFKGNTLILIKGSRGIHLEDIVI